MAGVLSKEKKAIAPSAGIQVKVEAKEGKEEEKGVRVSHKGRAPSNLGGKQGDHISAYALFHACVINKCEDLSVEEAIKTVLYVVDYYTDSDTADKVFAQIKEEKEAAKFLDEKELQQVVAALRESKLPKELIAKSEQQLKVSQIAFMEKILSEIISIHLTLRNKMELTAFPSEGNILPPPGEGARIKKAIKILNKSGLPLDIDEIKQAIKELFWFPEIPEDKLLSPSSAEWKKAAKKYSSAALPRTNDLDVLCQVVENHLRLIFLCYPRFHQAQKQIITEFVLEVIKDWPQNFKLPQNRETLSTTVDLNLTYHYKLFEEIWSTPSKKGKGKEEKEEPKEEGRIRFLEMDLSRSDSDDSSVHSHDLSGGESEGEHSAHPPPLIHYSGERYSFDEVRDYLSEALRQSKKAASALATAAAQPLKFK